MRRSRSPTRLTMGLAGLLGGWLLVVAPGEAQPVGPGAGTYAVEGGSYSIELEPQGDTLVVVEPNKRSIYQRQADGTFHVYNPNTSTTYGIRVIDDHTIEAFKPGQTGNVPTRLSRVGAAPAHSTSPPVADARPAPGPPAVRAVPLPPSAPAAGDRYAAIARAYEQRAKDDPGSVHAWAACAAAAMKRSVVDAAEADAYAVQMIQMLKVIIVDPARSPCEDAIPASLWTAVPTPATSGAASAAAPRPDPAAERAVAEAAEQERLRRLNADADARAVADAARRADERRTYEAKLAEAQAAQDRFARDQAAYEAEAARSRAAADAYQRQLEAYRRAGGKATPN